MYDLGAVEEVTEIGLKTPDGTVFWPPALYRDAPLGTAEERAQFPTILRQAAADLNHEPEGWVAGYCWVARAKTTFTIYHQGGDTYPIDALPQVAPAVEPASTPNQ